MSETHLHFFVMHMGQKSASIYHKKYLWRTDEHFFPHRSRKQTLHMYNKQSKNKLLFSSFGHTFLGILLMYRVAKKITLHFKRRYLTNNTSYRNEKATKPRILQLSFEWYAPLWPCEPQKWSKWPLEQNRPTKKVFKSGLIGYFVWMVGAKKF
jgi:hypothetical protein